MIPVYLYTGPETGARDDAVNAVKKSLEKKYGALEQYSFYASETPVQEFMAVLQNESLFSPAVCVTVKNAEAIKKKDDVETILSWIASSPPETNALILVSGEIAVESKIEKAVPASNKKIFWEMFENQKIPWLQSFCAKNGYAISEQAAETLLELVENNTRALSNECSRFFVCFPPGHEITEDDVDAVIAHTKEENVFSLFDGMASSEHSPAGRLETALEILQKIRLSKENSSVMVIAGLSSCFRKLGVWHKLASSGSLDDFNLKINGFSSKKIKSQYARASSVWTAGQTAAILSSLAAADMEIRSGGNRIEDILLEKLAYEICVKKGAPSAVYVPDPF
ncbi:MAG: DNA polymerase III subunit delta [Treponema sp.]